MATQFSFAQPDRPADSCCGPQVTTKTEALRSEVREEVKERLGATREEMEEVKFKLNEEREKRLKLEKQVCLSTPSSASAGQLHLFRALCASP
jgi:hypothetical protein